jgi:hypothetical protein
VESLEQSPPKHHWDVKIYKRIIASLSVFSAVATIVALLIQIRVV